MVQPTKTKESATTSLSACWVILGVSIICQTLAQTAGSLKCIYIDLFLCVDIVHGRPWFLVSSKRESAQNLTGIISEQAQSLARKEGLPIRLVTTLHHTLAFKSENTFCTTDPFIYIYIYFFFLKFYSFINIKSSQIKSRNSVFLQFKENVDATHKEQRRCT